MCKYQYINSKNVFDGDVMDYEETFDKLKYFIKTGIIVLSILVLIVLGIKYIPEAIHVTNSATSVDLPIYAVDQDKKVLSLSFESNMNSQNTEQILEILSVYDVKATFFITGEWAAKFKDETKAIAAAGHDIGNNSENHKDLTLLSKQETIEEILNQHTRIKELTGVDMNLFRAPYGEFNNSLLDITNDLGYYCIQWNIDSLDWKDYGVESIIKTIVYHDSLNNGSIIRMHNGSKYTAEALDAVISYLQEEGYTFVPISQLIYSDDFYIDETGTQFEKNK
ncbi:MAG: polysaccharide deacetylase family protein [Anaerocolumna sp.]